jgi:hypothetical protein
VQTTSRDLPNNAQRSPSLTSCQETSGVTIAFVTEEEIREIQDSASLPTLYVLNAASLAKPHAIEQLSAELIGYSVDVVVVSETHPKKKHADSVVQIPEYSIFRRDRPGRKDGGVAIYIRCSIPASEWYPVPDLDPMYEMLWVQLFMSAARRSSVRSIIRQLQYTKRRIYSAILKLPSIKYSMSIQRHESSWPVISTPT